ncbi:hypothetical protein [Streptomyces sp. NPDC059466]|uniref:hypothetical protein n=1 Tax=unclassified Streptomyces TaxID=2593676 RepID=UPI00369F400D
MANVVWHAKLRIFLDLTKDDLDHPEYEDLWSTVYAMDRMLAARGVPVAERELQCGGVCKDAGVVAWMHLRMRNGRREAVHERREDEERHVVPMSDEHKAYQERILRTAEEAGFSGGSEVRTRVGRSWIQTDTLVEGDGGRRIGWEVQLSAVGGDGPRSVRARAAKAEKNGITPAWHTDRAAFADRNDTHWTRSDRLPAYVIARTGDLRVVSGFRALDFWICDSHADYPCPDGVRRCSQAHATPKPRDVLFDDLVRRTAAGTIVPVQFRTATKVHRFWVTDADRDRLEDLYGDPTRLPPVQVEDQQHARVRASLNRPTCHVHAPTPLSAPPALPSTERPQHPLPAQPAAPAAETTAVLAEPVLTPHSQHQPAVPAGENRIGLPATMITLQRTADRERRNLEQMHDHGDRADQRRTWFEAAAAVQDAVTCYAQAKRLNRVEVAQELRRTVGTYRGASTE